jgi:hypothetical protein
MIRLSATQREAVEREAESMPLPGTTGIRVAWDDGVPAPVS